MPSTQPRPAAPSTVDQPRDLPVIIRRVRCPKCKTAADTRRGGTDCLVCLLSVAVLAPPADGLVIPVDALGLVLR